MKIQLSLDSLHNEDVVATVLSQKNIYLKKKIPDNGTDMQT